MRLTILGVKPSGLVEVTASTSSCALQPSGAFQVSFVVHFVVGFADVSHPALCSTGADGYAAALIRQQPPFVIGDVVCCLSSFHVYPSSYGVPLARRRGHCPDHFISRTAQQRTWYR